MDCNIIKDLIPLYIDGCCSEESQKIVEEHIENCSTCKRLYKEMNAPSDIVTVSDTPVRLNKINDWKASVLQSVLLFVSFGLITFGVAIESQTPYNMFNGVCALNFVVPVTGFMLSLANWYFVKLYKSRKSFSNYSFLVTLVITLCAYIWAWTHYEMSIFELFSGRDFFGFFDVLFGFLFQNGIGFLLTAFLVVLSKILSNQYAKMLGKE